MLKTVALISMLLLMLGNGLAEDSGKLEMAERLYRRQEFARAYKLLASGYEAGSSFTVEYNLGLCQYRLNDLFRAKTHFLKAFLLDAGDPGLLSLLNAVNRGLGLQTDSGFYVSRNPLWIACKTLAGGSRLQWLIWFFFYLGNAAFLAAFLSKRSRMLVLAVLFALITLFLLAAGLVQYREHFLVERGVVADDATLYAGPDTKELQLDRIRKGMVLKILERQDNWRQVLVENRYAGWITSEKIEAIP
jgi:hypothetical protein